MTYARLFLVSLVLAVCASAQAVTITSNTRVLMGEQLIITNPQPVTVTVRVAALPAPGQTAPAGYVFTLAPGASETLLPSPAATIMNVESGAPLTFSSAPLQMAHASRAISTHFSYSAHSPNRSILVGLFAAEVRVKAYAKRGDAAPTKTLTLNSYFATSFVKLSASGLFPAGTAIDYPYVTVEPIRGQAVVTDDQPIGRQRSVRFGWMPGPAIRVDGGASCVNGTYSATTPTIPGVANDWQIHNGAAIGGLAGENISFRATSAGILTLVGHASRGTANGYNEVSILVSDVPQLSGLEATSVVSGQDVTFTWPIQGPYLTATFTGDDLPASGVTVNYQSGSFSYRTGSTGTKDAHIGVSTECGTGGMSVRYTVSASCVDPNPTPSGDSNIAVDESTTLTAGPAQSHSWSVVSGPGTIVGGTSSSSITLKGTGVGTVRVRHEAANGSCVAVGTIDITVSPAKPAVTITATPPSVPRGTVSVIRVTVSSSGASSWTMTTTDSGLSQAAGSGSGEYEFEVNYNSLTRGTTTIEVTVVGVGGTTVKQVQVTVT